MEGGARGLERSRAVLNRQASALASEAGAGDAGAGGRGGSLGGGSPGRARIKKRRSSDRGLAVGEAAAAATDVSFSTIR